MKLSDLFENFQGASYKHVVTGEVMPPDGNHAAAIWGFSGENDAREEQIHDEIQAGNWIAGFVTSDGRFVTRSEAASYVDAEVKYLDSDDPEFQDAWLG